MAYDMTDKIVLSCPPTTGVDLSGAQYEFVMMASDGTVDKCSGSNYATGIVDNVPSAAVDSTDSLFQFPVAVVLSGVTRLRVAAAQAIGTFLSPSSANDGRGDNASGALKYARAIALQTASAADDVIAVRLIDQNPS